MVKTNRSLPVKMEIVSFNRDSYYTPNIISETSPYQIHIRLTAPNFFNKYFQFLSLSLEDKIFLSPHSRDKNKYFPSLSTTFF